MSESLDKAVNTAAELCRQFEGFSSKPYICPAGYPTIGYGTVYKPDGSKVTMQDAPISKEVAEEWLLHELRNNYMAGVLRASPVLISNPDVLAAMTDFAYNLGIGRYRGSTLRRKINAQDWDGAREQLMRWVNGTVQGVFRPLPGLVRRRKAEIALFMG